MHCHLLVIFIDRAFTKCCDSAQVHFHVLASGSQAAQGNIATSWITAQISTLNKAFSLAGVSFVLASVSRTVNSAWYNMQQGSSDEVRAQV